MTQQEEDKLREGFSKEVETEFGSQFVQDYEREIADYWIAKIKEREESLVERIEKLNKIKGKCGEEYGGAYNKAIEDVINLINKENE